MPWKKLKAGVFSLFGETFKLAGKLVVGIGAVGIGLLLVATTTIDHQEGRSSRIV